jgi:hypothetical protein
MIRNCAMVIWPEKGRWSDTVAQFWGAECPGLPNWNERCKKWGDEPA